MYSILSFTRLCVNNTAYRLTTSDNVSAYVTSSLENGQSKIICSNTIEILKIIFMKVPKTALILWSILLRRESPTSFDLNRIFPL